VFNGLTVFRFNGREVGRRAFDFFRCRHGVVPWLKVDGLATF
jgi:hypothetical protein